MQERRQRTRKKVNSNKNSKIGAESVVLAIAMIFFVISIGGSIFGFLTRDTIATMVVAQGSLDRPIIINGIIVRDETVYRAATSGEVVFNVPHGERIRAGTMVSSIHTEFGTALSNEQERLQERILALQEQRVEVSAVSSDVANINTTISNIFVSNMHLMAGNDFSHIYTLHTNVERTLEHRNDLLLNENRGAVLAYTSENRQLANRIADINSAITASAGGIVSHVVDGFEEIFNTENMSYITKEQTRMRVDIDPLHRVRQVGPNESVFKIVNSNDWYIAAYIQNDLIRGWNTNTNTTIHVEINGRFEPLMVRVHSIYSGEGESFVILRSTRRMIDFLGMRSINFQTHDSIFTGLKIPESAIIEKTFLKIPEEFATWSTSQNRMVTKIENGVLQDVHITTRALRNVERAEGYIFIMQDFNNLRRGEVIIHPEDGREYRIEEIVVNSGVFRTNNGVASFTSINMDGIIRGSAGYVILNTDLNFGGLNVHDRIVTDAANLNITEGTIIHQMGG